MKSKRFLSELDLSFSIFFYPKKGIHNIWIVLFYHIIKSIVRSHECVDGGSVLDTLTDPFYCFWAVRSTKCYIFVYFVGSGVEQNASSMDRDEYKKACSILSV